LVTFNIENQNDITEDMVNEVSLGQIVVRREGITKVAGTDKYLLSNIAVLSIINIVGTSNDTGLEYTFIENTDFSLIDDDGDGKLDTIDWSIGGIAPVDSTVFYVDYVYQGVPSRTIRAIQQGTTLRDFYQPASRKMEQYSRQQDVYIKDAFLPDAGDDATDQHAKLVGTQRIAAAKAVGAIICTKDTAEDNDVLIPIDKIIGTTPRFAGEEVIQFKTVQNPYQGTGYAGVVKAGQLEGHATIEASSAGADGLIGTSLLDNMISSITDIDSINNPLQQAYLKMWRRYDQSLEDTEVEEQVESGDVTVILDPGTYTINDVIAVWVSDTPAAPGGNPDYTSGNYYAGTFDRTTGVININIGLSATNYVFVAFIDEDEVLRFKAIDYGYSENDVAIVTTVGTSADKINISITDSSGKITETFTNIDNDGASIATAINGVSTMITVTTTLVKSISFISDYLQSGSGPTSGGRDLENTVDLKDRIPTQIDRIEKATEPAIIAELRDLEQVSNVSAFDAGELFGSQVLPDGTAKVLITQVGGGSFLSSVISSIQDIVESTKALGINIEVVEPDAITISMTVQVTFKEGVGNQTSYRSQVRNRIETYLRGLAIGEDVILARIAAVLEEVDPTESFIEDITIISIQKNSIDQLLVNVVIQQYEQVSLGTVSVV